MIQKLTKPINVTIYTLINELKRVTDSMRTSKIIFPATDARFLEGVTSAKFSRSESSVTKPGKVTEENVSFFEKVVQDISSVRAAQEFSNKCV